jgi:hypothetical protein
MEYKCEATSVEGFVQQLAANYLPHGYWFYVTGVVPEGKDPRMVDAKLLSKYGVSLSRQARARRKQAGFANLHYLRFDRSWMLLATPGEHRFFTDEANSMRDARKCPVQFAGYSIAVKRGGFLQKSHPDEPALADGKLRVRVQIGRHRFLELKAYFLEQATRTSVERLGRELYCLPFEPYAPVRKQLLGLLRLINVKRKAAGLAPLGVEVLRYRRRIVKPFEPEVFDVAA